MAEAATIGLGRNPSADPWCSLTTTASKPTRSAHSAMSRVAVWSSAAVAGPDAGRPHVEAHEREHGPPMVVVATATIVLTRPTPEPSAPSPPAVDFCRPFGEGQTLPVLDRIVPEAARRFGDHPALLGADGRPASYVEVDQRSDEVAVGLSRRGIGLGSVVALTLPSVPEYVIAYAALAKVGAVTAGDQPAPDRRRAGHRPRGGRPRPRAGRPGTRSTPCGSAASRPPPCPTTPSAPSPSSSPRGRPAAPGAPSSGSASWPPSPPPTWATPGAAAGRCWRRPSSRTSAS